MISRGEAKSPKGPALTWMSGRRVWVADGEDGLSVALIGGSSKTKRG